MTPARPPLCSWLPSLAFCAVALPSAALSGCGEDSPGAPDGGIGGPDSVTVRVLPSDGAYSPNPGVTVLFHDSAGNLVARAETDADGRASALLPDGGSVTSARRSGSRRLFQTVLGVAPGEIIDLGIESYPQPDVDFAGNMAVRIADWPGGDPAGYLVASTCQFYREVSPGELAYLDFYDSCLDDTARFLLLAVDSEQRPLAFTSKTLPFANGAYVELDAPWQEISPVHVAAFGLPANLFRAAFEYDALDDGKLYYVDRVELDRPLTDVAADLRFPNGVGAATWLGLTLQRDEDARVAQYLDTPPAETVNVPVLSLPWIDAIAVAGDGRTVALTLSAELDRPWDGTDVRLSRGDADWEVLLPPRTTDFVLPALPDDLVSYWPTSGTGSAAATLEDLPGVDGYAAYRRDGIIHFNGHRAPYLLPAGKRASIGDNLLQ